MPSRFARASSPAYSSTNRKCAVATAAHSAAAISGDAGVAITCTSAFAAALTAATLATTTLAAALAAAMEQEEMAIKKQMSERLKRAREASQHRAAEALTDTVGVLKQSPRETFNP